MELATPEAAVAAEMRLMSEAGLAGTSVAFLDYLKEIPYFNRSCLNLAGFS